MEKRNHVLSYIINLCFFLYFIILIAERSISVTLSFINGVNIFSDWFNGYVYMMVFLSIGSFIIFLIRKCRFEMVAIFVPSEETSFYNLCIASGILLLSGMVHTEYTIPVIQFIAYGILIIAILLRTILSSENCSSRPLLWISFVYLVCFSMAIPIMYRSNIEHNLAFHIIEAAASFFLVIVFTFLMLRIFKGRVNLFALFPIILATVFDAVLIVMRWNEEINWFLLIFISLSVLIFVVGYLFNYIRNKHLQK